MGVRLTSVHYAVGESIEMCCEREIHEEVGVRVTDVQYVASQPWPMPSVLMVGCTATATTTTINVSSLPCYFVSGIFNDHLHSMRKCACVNARGIPPAV